MPKVNVDRMLLALLVSVSVFASSIAIILVSAFAIARNVDPKLVATLLIAPWMMSVGIAIWDRLASKIKK